MTLNARLRKRDMDLFIAILKRGESGIKLVYNELFKNITATISLPKFRDYIKSGDFVAIKNLLHTTGGLGLFEERLTSVLFENGLLFGRHQSKLYKDILGVSISRQIMSQGYLSMFGGIVDQQVLNLTQNISKEVMLNITETIQRHRMQAVTVSGTVKELKEIVPLSNKQAYALNKYKYDIVERGERARSILNDADATQKQIEIATRDAKNAANLDQLIDRKSKKMQTIRAKVIARNEASSLTNRLKFEQSKKLVEVDVNRKYTKEWYCIGDDRSRESHLMMGVKYGTGKGIDMNASFLGGVSPLLYPRDPMGHVIDIIECRCRMVLNVGGVRRS